MAQVSGKKRQFPAPHFIGSANVIHHTALLTVITCVCVSQSEQCVKLAKVMQKCVIWTLTPLSSYFPETNWSYRAVLNPKSCLCGSEPALSHSAVCFCYQCHTQTNTSPRLFASSLSKLVITLILWRRSDDKLFESMTSVCVCVWELHGAEIKMVKGKCVSLHRDNNKPQSWVVSFMNGH